MSALGFVSRPATANNPSRLSSLTLSIPENTFTRVLAVPSCLLLSLGFASVAEMAFSWLALIYSFTTLRSQVDHSHPHASDESDEQDITFFLNVIGSAMTFNVAYSTLNALFMCLGLPRFRSMFVFGGAFLTILAPFGLGAAVASAAAVHSIVDSDSYDAFTTNLSGSDVLSESELEPLFVGVVGAFVFRLAIMCALSFYLISRLN